MAEQALEDAARQPAAGEPPAPEPEVEQEPADRSSPAVLIVNGGNVVVNWVASRENPSDRLLRGPAAAWTGMFGRVASDVWMGGCSFRYPCSGGWTS